MLIYGCRHLHSQHGSVINPFIEAVIPINANWLDTCSMQIMCSTPVPAYLAWENQAHLSSSFSFEGVTL